MQDTVGFWDGEKWTGQTRPTRAAGSKLRGGHVALALFVAAAVVVTVVGYVSIATRSG